MALLSGDIPLCSVPPKVTFLLVGVDPLAELISAVHLNNNNKNWLTALVNFMIDLVPADVGQDGFIIRMNRGLWCHIGVADTF